MSQHLETHAEDEELALEAFAGELSRVLEPRRHDAGELRKSVRRRFLRRSGTVLAAASMALLAALTVWPQGELGVPASAPAAGEADLGLRGEAPDLELEPELTEEAAREAAEEAERERLDPSAVLDESDDAPRVGTDLDAARDSR